ncbi:MAG TPA: hypothetical protein VE990_18205 [Acidimicrobiales bacterium]|nr:hypothetical protein [Acidimicrobiales bacterium]
MEAHDRRWRLSGRAGLWGRRAVAALAAAELGAAVLIAPVAAHSKTGERPPVRTPVVAAPLPAAPSLVDPAPAPTTTTTAAPAVATGVGQLTLSVVDPTRQTVDQGQVISPTRSLPTLVLYPAVGPHGAADVVGAQAAPGRHPLIVFAHGYAVTALTYEHLLHAWAAAGFVVAAPAFPLQTAGGPLDEADLVNEPGDISAVITAVLVQSAAANGVLGGRVDPARIAVAGHSDGAVAALASAFGTQDRRIGPVISMSGAGRPGIPHADPRHPLLIVQGDSDDIDPQQNSFAVYNEAVAPRIYLDLIGGGHLPPVADDTPWRPIVESVTIAFLSHYLGGGATIGALAAAGAHPGLSMIGGQP